MIALTQRVTHQTVSQKELKRATRSTKGNGLDQKVIHQMMNQRKLKSTRNTGEDERGRKVMTQTARQREQARRKLTTRRDSITLHLIIITKQHTETVTAELLLTLHTVTVNNIYFICTNSFIIQVLSCIVGVSFSYHYDIVTSDK